MLVYVRCVSSDDRFMSGDEQPNTESTTLWSRCGDQTYVRASPVWKFTQCKHSYHYWSLTRPSDSIRKPFSSPARLGGLGLPELSSLCDIRFLLLATAVSPSATLFLTAPFPLLRYLLLSYIGSFRLVNGRLRNFVLCFQFCMRILLSSNGMM